jgi:quercetin dioxygenase-like cupin family protein
MQALVSDARHGPAIEQACDACQAELRARPGLAETWRVVVPQLELSGAASALGSLWVFAFAPHGASKTHKHSNSTQYTRTWRGQGNLRIGEPAQPVVISMDDAEWAVIPAGVFHQAVAGADGWCVVSFQTAPAADLREEPLDGAPQHYVSETP